MELTWTESLEMMSDMMDDFAEWADFEADMETNPFAEYDRPPFEE